MADPKRQDGVPASVRSCGHAHPSVAEMELWKADIERRLRFVELQLETIRLGVTQPLSRREPTDAVRDAAESDPGP